ncbi:hypothetical protein GUITHDRAFT_166357 [Guillardia theta CCMP2712]|uniref:FZ domain-containing protein n=2 Tax=Guillardia theta TaxID=55529 RepID=L1IDE7_GUITC|nr:hypothetical protein GUITHDRAFT_166357 [Guillardia theta CCMP2712]EKX33840.1 hypothetical protein GUITHDRAFT_166357 [Guillardia theta CCMP2712]|mmetsp:Transcript_33805/g.106050  ORF Transcript_33805/g.106050 Transcript_33805/m.106050 type:complete len:226 (+) Transcript_33805:289-966(+)|eukprot:XP_005820820.1 hypothetical protein GUITHDRAFT_166357 [Guillardia theta CCMP2712]
MIARNSLKASSFFTAFVVFLLFSLPLCNGLDCYNSSVTVSSPEGLCGSRTFMAASCADDQGAADDMAKQMYQVMLQTFLPIGYDFPTKYWPCSSFYDWAFCHSKVKQSASCGGMCNMLWGVMESAMTRCTSSSQCSKPSINVSSVSSYKKPCCSSMKDLVASSCTLTGTDLETAVNSLRTDIYPKCSDKDCFTFSASRGSKTGVRVTVVLLLSMVCLVRSIFPPL